jgi:hypothetical protein
VPNSEGVDRSSGVIVDVSHDKQMYYRRKRKCRKMPSQMKKSGVKAGMMSVE